MIVSFVNIFFFSSDLKIEDSTPHQEQLKYPISPEREDLSRPNKNTKKNMYDILVYIYFVYFILSLLMLHFSSQFYLVFVL